MTVIFGMVMSLDGYVAGPNNDHSHLYPEAMAQAGAVNTESLQEAMRNNGAVVMGRRTYDMGNGDYTGYEFQNPIFVVTHHPPATPAKGENENLKFHFVTDGLAAAIEQAKAAAGAKTVTVVGGVDIGRQGIEQGLFDQLDINISPVLLGSGLRLFEHLDISPIDLEIISVVSLPFWTEFRYRIVK